MLVSKSKQRITFTAAILGPMITIVPVPTRLVDEDQEKTIQHVLESACQQVKITCYTDMANLLFAQNRFNQPKEKITFV